MLKLNISNARRFLESFASVVFAYINLFLPGFYGPAFLSLFWRGIFDGYCNRAIFRGQQP